MIKLNRKKVILKKIIAEDSDYVDASPAERIEFIWELTQEIWSLKDKEIAQRRLQRNITNFYKK